LVSQSFVESSILLRRNDLINLLALDELDAQVSFGNLMVCDEICLKKSKYSFIYRLVCVLKNVTNFTAKAVIVTFFSEFILINFKLL
jgi:hypothetical protein